MGRIARSQDALAALDFADLGAVDFGVVDLALDAAASSAPVALGVVPGWVTVRVGAETVASSSCALRVLGPDDAALVFVPLEDVVETETGAPRLIEGEIATLEGFGRARRWSVASVDGAVAAAAISFEPPLAPSLTRLAGRIGFDASRVTIETAAPERVG